MAPEQPKSNKFTALPSIRRHTGDSPRRQRIRGERAGVSGEGKTVTDRRVVRIGSTGTVLGQGLYRISRHGPVLKQNPSRCMAPEPRPRTTDFQSVAPPHPRKNGTAPQKKAKRCMAPEHPISNKFTAHPSIRRHTGDSPRRQRIRRERAGVSGEGKDCYGPKSRQDQQYRNRFRTGCLSEFAPEPGDEIQEI